MNIKQHRMLITFTSFFMNIIMTFSPHGAQLATHKTLLTLQAASIVLHKAPLLGSHRKA